MIAQEVRAGEPGAARMVRIAHLATIYATETPIPTRVALAARMGVTVATIQRDVGTSQFAQLLDEHIHGDMADHVRRAVALHAEAMADTEARWSDRLAAARWIHARWVGARRAMGAVRREEPAAVAQDESELLRSVLAETEGARALVADGLGPGGEGSVQP